MRNPNASPVLFQTGLYGPDGAAHTATYRWLGSMAIDRLGNIGLGFFASSVSTHPGLRFTGRVPSDPAGVMSQVTLSSGNTAVATVPASVTVAAGATSAGFTIATSSVTASVSVTVTASSGGVSRSAGFTLNAAAGACAAGRSKVTLNVTGPAGTVTSSPSGLNVSSGNTGSACFTNNNRVELRASRSVTWSGVTCDGSNTQTRCRFNVGTAPVSVTATLR